MEEGGNTLLFQLKSIFLHLIFNFHNKHSKKTLTYEYNDFFECFIFNFDFEEEETCLM